MLLLLLHSREREGSGHIERIFAVAKGRVSGRRRRRRPSRNSKDGKGKSRHTHIKRTPGVPRFPFYNKLRECNHAGKSSCSGDVQ